MMIQVQNAWQSPAISYYDNKSINIGKYNAYNELLWCEWVGHFYKMKFLAIPIPSFFTEHISENVPLDVSECVK